MGLVRIGRRGIGTLGACGLLVTAAAGPAIAQDDDRLDQDQMEELRDMPPRERALFMENRQRQRFAVRLRSQLQRSGELGPVEIEERVRAEVDDRFGPVSEELAAWRQARGLDGDGIQPIRRNPNGGGLVEAQPASGTEGRDRAAGREPGDEPRRPEGENPFSIQSGEPISLDLLVDEVADYIGINVFKDPALANERVEIKVATEVPRDRMLQLLSTILESRGFVLTRAGEGFYEVGRQAAVDFEGGELSTTRLLPTPNLRPSGLVTLLQSVFGGQGGPRGPQQGGGGGGLVISPVDELGILVVSGGANTLNRVEELLDRLSEAGEDQRLHLLAVENVAASFARERMVELHGRIAREAQGQPNQRQPQVAQVASAGFVSNLSDRLYVHSGNTLLFRGTEQELPEVADLLRVVDRLSPLRPKRYQSGGVTQEVVEAAEALGLGTSESVALQQGAGQARVNPGQFAQASAQGAGEAVGDSRFLVDEENGSFVYFGTETQHEVVASIVEQFRRDMIDNGTQIRVYRLVYAQAGAAGDAAGGGDAEGPEVATVSGDPGVAQLLRDLISDPERRQEGRFLPGSGGSGAVSDGDFVLQLDDEADAAIEEALGGTRLVATEENTVIVADPARNQVLIKAPALAHRQFERIIAELDQRQRQVRLDVQIVTLSTDDSFNWDTGFDLNFGDVNLTSIFGIQQTSNGDITTPIAVNAVSPGFAAAIIDNDEVPFALNTLASVGDSVSVSRPKLVASDNQTARLDSTDEVPFAETTQNANTTTTGQGGVAEAGTLVEITPRISDAGEITLALSIELSTFTGEPQDGLQPPALRNTFESQVSLPNNTTIVVGGFESETESESETGLPILKDIPLIGNLFKTISNSTTRRSVFVFITPTILDDPNDLGLRLLSEGPLKRAGIGDGMPTYRPVVIPVGSGADDTDEPERIERAEPSFEEDRGA